MLSRFERHQAASYGAAAVPSKTMCRQTLTTPDGPERHRRFYLAVQIDPPTSTPRYDISLLRNRASHVSAHAIPLRADRSSLRRSRAAEPSCARCKTVRSANDADDNRTAL